MIIFSPSSLLRGSTCACQGKPLSVTWSFLSGGRWSWVKTARLNSYFFPFIFNLAHRFWMQCIFLIINHTLYQGKVLFLNSFLFIKSCLRQSAMSEVWKIYGVNIYHISPPAVPVTQSFILTGWELPFTLSKAMQSHLMQKFHFLPPCLTKFSKMFACRL